MQPLCQLGPYRHPKNLPPLLTVSALWRRSESLSKHVYTALFFRTFYLPIYGHINFGRQRRGDGNHMNQIHQS